MPSQQVLDAFVAMVLSNQHDDAIATFYTPDSTMQENLDPPRKGRDGNVARERAVMDRAAKIHSALEGPVFVTGDRVVIRWIFRFDFADGTSITMDELAYQRWDGDQIAEERFYYDPAQRTRR
jgi:ketosteroid isomerase-like protein